MTVSRLGLRREFAGMPGPLLQLRSDVSYWHLADIDADAEHVRCWG
jgi:hypothetical protein